MTTLPEKCVLAKEQIGSALSRQSFSRKVFEPIWDFVEYLFPSATWEHLSQLDVLLLYATLASYTLSQAGFPEEKTLNVLNNVSGLRGRTAQRIQREVLTQLLEVMEMQPSQFMAIDAFLEQFSRPKTHPQLAGLILLVGWLYRYFGIDRYALEQLVAEELKETLDTARSHFSRDGNIEPKIDPNRGSLLITLPEADVQGQRVAEKLTLTIRTLLEKNSKLIAVFDLPYKSDLTGIECSTRERPTDTNPFEALLVPIRNVPPYRGLDPFTEETRHLFSGRDHEIQVFSDDMLCHRITVMRGASGIGKTSLVLAGLVANLIAQHHFPVVVTAQYKPNQNYPLAREVTEALITSAKRLFPDLNVSNLPFEADDIRAICRFLKNLFQQRMQKEHPRLFIIIDQLEAFLLGSTSEWQQQFFNRVIECDLDYGLDVGFLFAIRTEFFDLLETHKNNLIDLYAHVRRLMPLSQEAVKDTIERPARICRIEFESGVVEEIVKDLALTSSDVVTPQIQLVLATLYDAMRRANLKQITQTLYDQMGRCQGILSSFLNREIEEFPPTQRNLVKRVLIEMTTGSGTAVSVTVPELAKLCNTREDVMRSLMDQLARRTWLIRRTAPTLEGESTFRLTHEYLVSAIHTWLEPDERVLRRLRQHLNMLYRSWQESSESNLFLMTQSQLMEFQGRLAAVTSSQEHIAYYTKSALFETAADESLWEGYALLKDQDLLTKLIIDGLRALNPAVCSKAKELAVSAIDRIGQQLWLALPNLPWHARQSITDTFMQWKGSIPLAQEGLGSHDWRVYTVSRRLLAVRKAE